MHIADMHCDTISALLEEKERKGMASLLDNRLHLDLKRMKDSGYLLQNFALFVNRKKYPDVTERALLQWQLFEQEIQKNGDCIRQVFRYGDIAENERNGRMSALLTLEEGGILRGSFELLHSFYEKGVRMITLTWNYPNEIGFPSAGGYNREGLTERGFELVEEMQRLGVIVDVSHLSDQGFYDVTETVKGPFVASHSNARSVCSAARNLTDDMIRLLAEHGGVMGLNFYPDFLTRVEAGTENPGTIEAVIRHAIHIVNTGGIGVLGLGSDFDGIDGHRELPGAQAMPRLEHALEKAGFCASQREKILGENVLRVYRDTLPG